MRSIDIAHPEGLRRDLPPFRSGDRLRVHVRIREGEKERIQIFEGVCIRRKRGGPAATFTVRKISYGVGVERVFPVESPSVTKVEIKQRGHVRRSRLYYLRDLSGKKARLRSKIRDLSGLISDNEADGAMGIAPGEVEVAEAVEAEESAEAEAGAVEEVAEAEESAEQAPVDSSAETLVLDVSDSADDGDDKSD
ncbi:MAG: 50S ribosomal protein L19 [Myxococcota bacterium]